jgi:hypothetical protein
VCTTGRPADRPVACLRTVHGRVIRLGREA